MRGTPNLYFKSLNRPFTVFGVDRKLFCLILCCCYPIAYSAHFSPIMDIISGSLFMILHAMGVLITRIDHQIVEVYKRHIHYKKYYAPHSGLHSTLPLIKPSVPFYQGKRGLV